MPKLRCDRLYSFDNRTSTGDGCFFLLEPLASDLKKNTQSIINMEQQVLPCCQKKVKEGGTEGDHTRAQCKTQETNYHVDIRHARYLGSP